MLTKAAIIIGYFLVVLAAPVSGGDGLSAWDSDDGEYGCGPVGPSGGDQHS